MSSVTQTSDADLLELMRMLGPMGVRDIGAQLDVTATAVRQRLSRLLAQELVQRQTVRAGRGRPKHRYELTQKGLRQTGSNFTDLALVLWREIGSIADFEVRRTILLRVVRALVSSYAHQVQGRTTLEKMKSLSALLAQRRVPFSVEDVPGHLPVLTAHACPYPELAESDRTICIVERALFSELLQHDVQLAQCRLDGASCCQFQPS
ncbi:MAG: helix-turn-helix transcriptional regulator [Thermoguttaceae bacterium]|jgi:predicted ArsR family transcriptional regulator